MNSRSGMTRMWSACAWLGLSVLGQGAWAWGADRTVHVSPEGNDAWSGSLPAPNAAKADGPVASLTKARDLARALRAQGGGPVTIALRGGTYALEEPLMLTPADSGTADAPVIWTAYQGEAPVLSGGRRLTGWTRTTVNGQGAWVAPLDAREKAVPFRELWLDGKRLTRARWPKTGTLAVVGLTADEKPGEWSKGVGAFRFKGDDLKPWPGATKGEAIVATRWIESHLPLAAIDAQAHVVRFGKQSVFRIDAGDRYWVENVPECLTGPGEFVVDPAAGTVTLIAPTGVDPNRAQVVAPRLAQVLRLAGRPAEGAFVEHVVFRGLGFAYTEWFFDHPTIAQSEAAGQAGAEWSFQPDPKRSGFAQAAVGVPGAVAGRGARHCVFDRCTVSHTGTYGIELSQGCRDNKVVRCTLTDLGAGGLKIGEVVVRDDEKLQTARNEVSDCRITDGGNLYPSCIAIWIGQSSDNTVAHNEVHGFWYTAVSIGWTWGYARSAAQRNLVEWNHIHHIGTKTEGAAPLLSDMGCVYTLGNQEGTVLRNNHFHDVAGRNYGGWGIYFDEGTTHIRAENNLVYRTTHGGFHQHYGKENVVRNNLFAFGRDAQVQRTRIEDHLSFTFEDNLVLWDRGPLFAGSWGKLNVAFKGNTYWRTEKPNEVRFGEMTWDQWRSAGMDPNGKIADPHLTSPAQGDFRPTPQTQAALAGFKPFDVSAAGPR